MKPLEELTSEDFWAWFEGLTGERKFRPGDCKECLIGSFLRDTVDPDMSVRYQPFSGYQSLLAVKGFVLVGLHPSLNDISRRFDALEDEEHLHNVYEDDEGFALPNDFIQVLHREGKF